MPYIKTHITIVSSISSSFHPADSSPITLDILAGVSEEGTCMTTYGPKIDLHIQEHHTIKGRYVNVLVLHDYISKEFFDSCDHQLNELMFQNLNNNSNSFFRLATKLPDDRPTPLPLLTFGNNKNSLHLFEATSNISKMEEDILAMSGYLHRVLDGIENKVKQILTDIVQGRSDSVSDTMESLTSELEHVERSACYVSTEEKIPYPEINEERPTEHPDTCAVQVGRDLKHYRAHTDGGDLKPCNHSNDSFLHHEKRQSVITHAIVKSQQSETPVPDRVVSISHSSFPNPDGSYKYCKYVGHFSSVEDRFIPARDLDRIAMGGSNSLHMQMRGSQDGNFHHMESLLRKKNTRDFIRFVFSARLLQPFHLTRSRQMKCFQKYPPVSPYTEHNINNIVSMLKRVATGIIPASFCTNKSPRTEEYSKMREPQKRKKTSDFNWEDNRHINGPISDDEKFIRKSIVGSSPCYKNQYVATSTHLTEELYKRRTSIHIRDKSGDIIGWNGPLVKVEAGGNHTLLMPGDTLDGKRVDTLLGINSTNIKDDVYSSSNKQVIHIRRQAKNSSEILQLEETLRRGAGTINNIIIRGSGGALRKADANAVSTNDKNVHKYSATHHLPSGQKTDSLALAMFESIRTKRMINILSGNMYCGAWGVVKATYEFTSLENTLEEVKLYNKYLERLHKIDPDNYPASVNQEWEHEIAARLGACWRFECIPVIPDILDNTIYKDDRSWRVVEASVDDFLPPSIGVSRDTLEYDVGLKEGASFTDVTSIVQYIAHHELCLTEQKREELFPDFNANNEEGAQCFGQIDCAKREIQIGDIISGAIHGSAFTLAKTGGDCIDKQNRKVLKYPSFVVKDLIKLMKESNGISIGYGEALTMYNLKPVMGKPIHPATLAFETANCFAMEATGSYDTSLRINRNKKWVYRNGKSFVLAKESCDEAWEIIFKCILCSIISPTALLQIQHHRNLGDDVKYLVPSPDSTDLNEFITAINKFEWSQHMPHSNFKNIITSKEQMIRVIQQISEAGQDIFSKAIQGHPDNRPEIVKTLLAYLNEQLSLNLGEFQIQLLLRTIESCIHEPFGNVCKVPGGFGSKDGAAHFLYCWDSDSPVKVDEVPGLLLDFINKRAKEALAGENQNLSQEQCHRELLLLGLNWSKSLDCLVHSTGIGKRLDCSDTEHMLCMVYVMLKNTRPSTNAGKELTVRRIDGDKHYPVRFTVGGKLAKELPFMHNFLDKYSERLDAYKQLLKDESYEFRYLAEIFNIDHND